MLEVEEFAHLLIPVQTKGTNNRKHYAAFSEEGYIDSKGNPKLVEIEEMQSFFKKKGDYRLYTYFESMCHLIALMCMSRNYKGINELVHMYSLDFTLDCFLNTNIPSQLRSYLAKVLIYLHIDKDPLEEINLPNLTRVWQEIASAKTTIPSSLAPIEKSLLTMKEFCIEFFVGMNGIQRSHTVDVNQLTLQVLIIVEKMIILGFYTNEQELIKIINPIISLLDGSNDFTSQEEEDAYNAHQQKVNEATQNSQTSKLEPFKRNKELRYANNQKNRVIIEIKKQIIQILNRVIDIQNDIRLTRFLIEFNKSDTQLMMSPHTAGQELVFLQNVQSS